jgi:hypothetical protein
MMHWCDRCRRETGSMLGASIGRPTGSALLFDGSEGTSDLSLTALVHLLPKRRSQDYKRPGGVSGCKRGVGLSIVTTQQHVTSSTWVLPAGSLGEGRPIATAISSADPAVSRSAEAALAIATVRSRQFLRTRAVVAAFWE